MADTTLRTEDLTLANRGGQDSTTVEVGANGTVQLPAGFNFGTAEFTREGPDLVMTMPNGREVIVQDYFASETPATLQTPQGAELAGDTAMRLAAANVPAQYAQAAAVATEQPIGQVQSVSGTVTAIRANGQRVELQEGDPVYQGDILQSGAKGSIGIVLADETTFSMAENGRMVLDEMIYDPSSQEGKVSMSVLQGVFTFVSGSVAKVDPDAMTLKTPVATIGIRGTQVGVNLGENSDGTPKLDVGLMEERDGFVGEVVISNNAGIQILNLPDQVSQITRVDLPPSTPRVISRTEVRDTFQGALDSLPTNVGTGNNYRAGPSDPAGQKASNAPADDFAVAVNTQGQGGGDRDRELVDFEVAAGGTQPEEVGPAVGTGDPIDVTADIEPDPVVDVPPPPPEVVVAPPETQPTTPFVEPVRPPDAPIIVDADGADGATISASAESGVEDGGAIALNLSTALIDADGSETITSIVISGVPADASLSAGTKNPDGTWTLTQDQLAGLTFTAAPDYSGTVNLTMAVTTTDAADGTVATTKTTTAGIAVTVTAAGDVTVDVADVSGDEHSLINLGLSTASFAITDADGSEAVQSIVLTFNNLPAGSTVIGATKNPDGSYTVASAADLSTVGVLTPVNYSGDFGATLTVTSNEGSSAQNFDISVADINDPPQITSSPVFAVLEDLSIQITKAKLLEGVSDADSAELSIASLTVNGGQGSLSGPDADGNYTYTPGAFYNSLAVGQTVPLTFTYTVSDGEGGTATASSSITIVGTNDGPVANLDTLGLAEDIALTIDPATLLANDSDPDSGATLTIQSVQAPTNGMVALVDGQVVFTPSPNYNGPASFTYTAVDEHGATSTATVTLSIDPVNDVPVAVNDVFSLAEDLALTLAPSQLLTNDQNPDGGSLALVSVQDALHGTVAIVDGEVVFTPALNYNGPASFTYTIRDASGDTSTATVSLTIDPVNDVPVAVNDVFSLAEDLALTLAPSQLLGNDQNPDGGSLALVSVQEALHGTVAIVDGEVVFTPALNYNGPASFTYTIRDASGDTSTATVTLTIDPLNDAPVAVNDVFTLAEDLALTLSPSQLLVNDSDPDNAHSELRLISVQDAAHGTVAIVDGQVVFTPALDYSGPASFTYTIQDPSGATSTATVSLSIAPTGDVLVVANDMTVQETDARLPIDLDINVAAGGGEVIQAITVQFTGVPAGASFNHGIYVPSTGIWTPNPLSTLSPEAQLEALSVTTPADWSGTFSGNVTVVTNEGTATDGFGVTVTPEGDVDVRPLSDVTGTEDAAHINLGLSASSFSITDADGSEDAQAITLTLDPLPAGTQILGATHNADGSYTVPNGAALASVAIKPAPDFAGEINVTLSVATDEGGLDSESFSVNIRPVEDINISVSNVTGNEDAPINLGLSTSSFSIGDVDGSEVLSSIKISFLNLPQGAVVQGATQNPDGSYTVASAADLDDITVIPPADWNGDFKATLTVTSNEGSEAKDFTIKVNPVNDAPVIISSPVYEVFEDASIIITPAQLLGGASDVDSANLTISNLTVNGGMGTLSGPNAQGNYTFTPGPAYNNMAVGDREPLSFTYTVSDGAGGTATASSTITIVGTNDGPTAVDDTNEVSDDVGSTIAGNVITGAGQTGGADSDPDVGFGGPENDDSLHLTSVTFKNTTYNFASQGQTDENGTYVVVDGDMGTLKIYDNGQYSYVKDTNTGGAAEQPWSASNTPIWTDPSEQQQTTANQVSQSNMTVPAGGESVTVTFQGEGAGYKNVLGWYKIGEDGKPTEPQLIWANASQQGSGGTLIAGQSQVTLEGLEPGEKFGFFIIRDGHNNFPWLDENDALQFNSDGDLVSGSRTIDEKFLFHALDPNFDDNNLNLDDRAHARSGIDPDTNELMVGFEDLWNGGDRDYNDVMFSISYNGTGTGATTDQFTYTVADESGATDTATLTISLDAENDAPVARIDAGTTDEDQSITINVLANDSDPEGDTLSVIGATQPEHGNIVLNPNGTITYTPDPDYNGADSFTYTISDGQGGTSTATVQLTVNPQNDVPVAVNDIRTLDEDASATIAVLANDQNPDGGALTLDSVTQPAHGTVTINDDGTVTYTPHADYTGSDTFTYVIRDASGDTSTATVQLTVNPQNDVPVAVNDIRTLDEDSSATLNVLANDLNPDGGSLTLQSVGQPAHGTVTFNNDGTVTYTPHANYNGTDSFTYVIRDASGDTSTATVALTVNPVNDVPVAFNDAKTLDEDSSTTISVLANDQNPDGGALTVQGVGQAQHGTVTLNTDGTVTYTPHADYNGSDTFTYTVVDASGDTSTATVTLTVNPQNDVPVAVADAQTLNEDASAIIDVLANDINSDVGALQLQSFGQPAHGTVTLGENGQLVYTPVANYNGSDSFTYTIVDASGDTSTATVSLTVTPQNDVPVAVNDVRTLDEDSSATINVLANDLNPDGGNLTLLSVGQPEHGSVSIGDNGQVVYTPHANYNGSDSFTYVIRDASGDTSTATVNLTVNPQNDQPVVQSSPTFLMNEDGTITISTANLLEGTTDVDNDSLNISNLVVNGGVGTLAGPDAQGNYTYTPPTNFAGAVTLSYNVSDGHGGTVATSASINVEAVADQPPLTVHMEGVAGSGHDEDLFPEMAHDISNIVMYLQSPTGEITKVKIDNFSAGQNDVRDADELALADFVAENYPGMDVVAMTIKAGNNKTPGAGPGEGQLFILDAGMTQSDLPLSASADDTYQYSQTLDGVEPSGQNSLTGGVAVFSVEVDINTSLVDTDGSESLSITISNVPAGASFSKGTANDDGTWTLSPADLDGLQMFVDRSVGDDFSITVTSTSTESSNLDQASTTVTATIGVNVGPVAENDAGTLNEDAALTINVLANDDDSDGDSLVVTGVTQPTHGTVVLNDDGTVTYTPAANYNGDDSFTYTISDGQGGTSTATVSLTVNPQNDVPVAVSDTFTLNEDNALSLTPSQLLGNDSDLDGDSLTIQSVQGASHGTVSLVDGQVVFTPAANYSGPASFTYTVSDGQGGTTTGTANITVGPMGDVTVNASNVTGGQGQAVNLGLSANSFAITDTDGSETVSEIRISFSNLPQGATVQGATLVGGAYVVASAAALANVTVIPPANYSGSFGATLTVVSNEGSAAQNFTVAVSANQAPVITSSPSFTVNEDAAITITKAQLLAGASDAEGNALSVQDLVVNGGQGVLSGPDANGSYTYTPPADFSGSVTLSYKVSDGTNAVNQTATVGVTADADAPTLTTSVAFDEYVPTATAVDFGSMASQIQSGHSVTITGVPSDAVLSAGTKNSDGSWTLTGSQCTGLTITPAAGSQASFSLGVTVTNTNTSQSLINASFSSGQEGFTYSEDLLGTCTTNRAWNSSGSEQLQLKLGGGSAEHMSAAFSKTVNVDSAGATTLSFKYRLQQHDDYENDETSSLYLLVDGQIVQVNGSDVIRSMSGGGDSGWQTVTVNLGTLSAGNHTIMLAGYNNKATESSEVTTISFDDVVMTKSGGSTTVTSGSVTVTPAEQGHVYDLNIASALRDTDGSESLSITVGGLPSGAVLNHGTYDATTGKWTLSSSDLADLQITAPGGTSLPFNLTVESKSTESSNADTATTSATVQVTGVADIADLSVDSSLLTTTYSATAIPLSSSTLSAIQSGYTVTISGVPTGATLNYGTDNGDGTWTVPGANAGSLTITPPVNYSGSLNLSATVNSPSGGTTTAFTANFNSGSDSFTYADGSFGGSTSTSLASGGRDHNDGVGDSGALELTLGDSSTSNAVSGGFSRTFTTTGSGTGTVTFSYHVDATDIESNDGEYARVMVSIDGANKGSGGNSYVAQVVGVDSGWVTVTVDLGTLAAGSHTLTIGGLLNKADNSNDVVDIDFDNVSVAVSAPSTVATQSNIAVTPTVASYTYDLNVAAALTDATGETLSVTIGSLPSGVTLSHGSQNADGSWTVPSDNLADLTITVPKTAAAFELSVSATTTDGGDVATITKTLDFSDHLGLSTADSLTGTSGNDTQYGGAGADALYGGEGNDTQWGGSGADAIYGQGGNDTIYGGSGDDAIYGGSGIDYLSGGEGSDVIYGESGNDIIIGGAGNDTLYGGEGADEFKFSIGDGNDTIMDFGSGDQLTFNGISLNGGDSVDFAADGNDVVITIIGQDGTQTNQVTLKDAASGMSAAEREHISDGYSVTDTGQGVQITVDQNS